MLTDFYVCMEGTSKAVESDDECSALVSSAYVSIRQHAPAHVSTRQHASAHVEEPDDECSALVSSATRLTDPSNRSSRSLRVALGIRPSLVLALLRL